MSKVKRGLQLSAAIVSIVFSAILIIGAIELISYFGPYMGLGYGVESIVVVSICILLFSIADIIICSFLCVNPDKKYQRNLLLAKSVGATIPTNSEGKGLTITALVLSSVLALLYIIGGSVWIVMPLISCGLFIAVLCIQKEKVQVQINGNVGNNNAVANNVVANNVATNTQDSVYNFSDPAIAKQVGQDAKKEVIRQAVENIEKKSTNSIDENIARIRKLYQDSVLTADEMKNLIMEELKKQK